MKAEVSPSEPGGRDTGALDAAPWVEFEVPESPSERDHAFRLLARWLVAASRKGAVGTGSGALADPENPLDVASAPKVVSKSR